MAEADEKLRIDCECGWKARVPASSAGRTIKCKRCEAKLVVPAPDGGDADRAPAKPAKRAKADDADPAPARADDADDGAVERVRSPRNIIAGAFLIAWASLVVISYAKTFEATARLRQVRYGPETALVIAVLFMIPIGVRALTRGLSGLPPAEARRVYGPARTLIALLLLLVALAFVPTLGTPPDERRRGAVGALRMITGAQSMFREGGRAKDGKVRFGTLAELIDASLLPRELEGGSGTGYALEVTVSTETPDFHWCAVAKPGSGSDPWLFVNGTGVVYGSPKPIVVDAKTCEIPQGMSVLGK